jgi:PKD repeat protein
MNNKFMRSLVVSTIGLACFGAVADAPAINQALINQTISTQFHPQVVTVADKIERTISMLSSARQIQTEQVIDQPGASFIKVHFSDLRLPVGTHVEVSNRDGTEVYRYGPGFSTPKTFDTESGDDGVRSFSSMSISGSYAAIRIVGNSTSLRTNQHQVTMDYYMKGYSEERIQALLQDAQTPTEELGTRSTCGVNERRDVQCWADTHPTEFDRARPVARLLMNGSGLCTGWRVGSDNHMFTNNHCVDTNSSVQTTEAWFNYQSTSCGGGSTETPTKVTGASMLQTDYTLDYTLFTINNFSSVASFGYLGLDPREANSQEQIYIPQHGSGNPKELAIESDQNTDNLCRIDAVSETGRAANTDMGYMCDTIGGSSGSPVLASVSNKVIALHHFGGCTNQGVKISKIWPQVSNHFGGVVPDGDNDIPGGNLPPTASFTSSCTELTCVFDASASSDSDGAISSYSWDFGDSATATGVNPTHSFAANGSYNVTLTVTDNDNAAASNTNAITVNDGTTGDNELVNGVTVSDLSGARNDQLNYTMEVPANASSLVFEMSGGSGDADLYVKFGSAPTLNSYDCRPYSGGNNETCTITNIQAGTYHVMLNGYSSFSATTLTGTFVVANTGNTYTNTNDYSIPDNNSTGISSPIDVTDGGSSSSISVDVNIVHTYIGDLTVDLIDPDGGVHNLHNRSGGSANDINQTYSVDVGSANRVGTWNLRVRDSANIDTGIIDSWSITL